MLDLFSIPAEEFFNPLIHDDSYFEISTTPTTTINFAKKEDCQMIYDILNKLRPDEIHKIVENPEPPYPYLLLAPF